VHYYFEGEGSETTLTKAEWNKYQQELVAYNEVKTVTGEASFTLAVEAEQKK
jgi:hypothetical protein